MRSSAYILKGRDRLAGASELKPYIHQDLFACCDREGEGYFEIGDYENALKSFRESVAVIELFLKDGKYPIEGTQSNHCHTVVCIAACLYKLGQIEACEDSLQKAYQIPLNYYGPEEMQEDPEYCLFAYRAAYHEHGLDDYKPCI